MQLTTDAFTILQNFAAINSNLMFRAGQDLITISPNKSVLAKAKFPVEIGQTFGIYDLRNFLSCLSLVGQDAALKFQDKSLVMQGTNGKIEYFFAEESTLITSDKSPKLPTSSKTVKFRITNDELERLRKACGTLGHRMIAITQGEDGHLSAKVFDKDQSNANVFTYRLSGTHDVDSEFSLVFDVTNLNVLPGDYDVEIAVEGISQFTHTEKPIIYWVGLEKKISYYKEL